jgi:adenylate kinase family enzyme
MDKLYTFIFIGRSGCGKGTQASLLIEELKREGKVSDKNPLFYIETGNKFRDFIAKTSHSSRQAKEVMDRSERQPDFLAVWMWADLLVTNLMGDEQLIFDGTPRSLGEAKVLDTALRFYGRQKPTVVYLDVSNDWSRERLAARGRSDDKAAGDIEKRLAWFESDVKPAIEFFEQNPDYEFIRVNGEQTIEEVHKELMEALNNKH